MSRLAFGVTGHLDGCGGVGHERCRAAADTRRSRGLRGIAVSASRGGTAFAWGPAGQAAGSRLARAGGRGADFAPARTGFAGSARGLVTGSDRAAARGQLSWSRRAAGGREAWRVARDRGFARDDASPADRARPCAGQTAAGAAGASGTCSLAFLDYLHISYVIYRNINTCLLVLFHGSPKIVRPAGYPVARSRGRKPIRKPLKESSRVRKTTSRPVDAATPSRLTPPSSLRAARSAPSRRSAPSA